MNKPTKKNKTNAKRTRELNKSKNNAGSTEKLSSEIVDETAFTADLVANLTNKLPPRLTERIKKLSINLWLTNKEETMRASGFTNQGTLQRDRLFAGDFPVVTQAVTVTGRSNLPRGAVLGWSTSSNHYLLSVKAANDGSQKPVAILAEELTLTGSETKGLVYLSGQFNSQALHFGAGHDAASVQKSLRVAGAGNIYLHNVQEA